MIDRPTTGSRRGEGRETESTAELSTSRSHTSRGVSVEVESL